MAGAESKTEPLDNGAEVDDSNDWKVFARRKERDDDDDDDGLRQCWRGAALLRAAQICGQPPAIVLCGLFLVIVIVISMRPSEFESRLRAVKSPRAAPPGFNESEFI